MRENAENRVAETAKYNDPLLERWRAYAWLGDDRAKKRAIRRTLRRHSTIWNDMTISCFASV
jgi:hypothetical protein